MDTGQFEAIGADRDTRLEDAIKKTAPGTALRHALDMIIAGHMGALICVRNTDNVLAAGRRRLQARRLLHGQPPL